MQIEAYLYYFENIFPNCLSNVYKGRKFDHGGRRGTHRLSLGTAAGAAGASGFGSPSVLRDFSSWRPGDGGSDPGRPAPTEAQRGGCGLAQFTVHCHSFFPNSPHASGSPPGCGRGRIFRAASLPALAPFHPVTARPLTSADWQGILLPRRQRPPPHRGPHTGRVCQRRSSFPRNRIGNWGRGEN